MCQAESNQKKPGFRLINMLDIKLFSSPEDEKICAAEMAASEPWITLGLSYENALNICSDKNLERYIAKDGGTMAGFILINTGAQFPGYIKILCVAASYRQKGIGSKLIRFAEERIFKDFPNIFLCVSSFNENARRFYIKEGFHVVGELTDYLIKGHSEILMRKTIGPRSEFRPSGMSVNKVSTNRD